MANNLLICGQPALYLLPKFSDEKINSSYKKHKLCYVIFNYLDLPKHAAGGKRKSGLNREILSTAPAQFYQLLRSKAEEAGALWIDIPTQTVKPSQRCYRCDAVKKKNLSERWHVCECGANCGRDENSARVILKYALQWAAGQELAEVSSCSSFAVLKHETATITL